MVLFITDIHLVGGRGHEHIGSMKWRNPNSGETGQSQTVELASWVETAGNEARVASGMGYVQVGVVKGTSPYLRTYANGQWTDNLLNLPKY